MQRTEGISDWAAWWWQWMQLPHSPTTSAVSAELMVSWVASGAGRAKEVAEVDRAMFRDDRVLDW